MGRLKRRIKQLVLLEHRLQEKTIQHLAVPGIEHDEDAVKKLQRFSDLLSGAGTLSTVSKWRARVKGRVLSAEHMKQQPKIPPLERFRNVAKLALICIRLCKYSHENVAASKDEYLSIVQVTEDFIPVLEPDDLFFDARIYRASKEQRLPVEASKILKRDPRYRTEKEVDYLHVVLRSIDAFADYPTKMQKRICKVGWYEAYEPKRAIVRQGAPPHAFYFILSGSVIVTRFDKNSGGTTFLVALHKGMSFGELAVINRSRRQATVSTGTITELLCISAKDFVEIFMSGGIKSVTDADQNSFIRSIPFLKHWPVECLSSHPQACMFQFFGRGTVLVRDSNYSDWIYIVKSGSLSVMKKLVEVHPRNNKQNESESESEDDEDISKLPIFQSFGTWDHRLKRKKKRHRTEKEVYRNQMEMEKRLEQTLPGFHNSQERLGLIDYDEIIQDFRSRVLPSRRMSMGGGLLPKITVEEISEESPQNKTDRESESTETEEENRVKLPKIRRTSKLRVMFQESEKETAKEVKNNNLLQVPKLKRTEQGVYLATDPSKHKSSKKVAIQEELYQKQLEYDKKIHEERSQTIGRKTIAHELDNKPIRDLTLTEKDIRPMFVQVQILERGQYFGLTKNVFPEQATSYSVVSNGAECILISKKFFFEKANEATLHHLRQVETLLPPEEELQEGLQDYVDWKAYRAKVYDRLVKNKTSRISRKSQFPTQFSGQYCFRTGPVAR